MDTKSTEIKIMNKMNIGLLVLITMVLLGCGKKFWEIPQEKIVPPQVKAVTKTEEPDTHFERQRKLILESEPLVKEVSLGRLESSNIIEITLMGVKTIPQFTDVIDRIYQSSWTKRYCVSDQCKTCSKFLECFDEELRGPCTHRYRERLEDSSSQLIFDKSSEELSVKIRIGQNTYPLGDIIDNKQTQIITRLQLSKEILAESDEVFLTVAPEPFQGNVQIGFLGLGQCSGLGKPEFKSNGPTSSSQFPLQERIEYKVSVVVEKIIEVKNE